MTDQHRQLLGQAARNTKGVSDVLADWSRRKRKPDKQDAERIGLILRSAIAIVDELSKPRQEPQRPVASKHETKLIRETAAAV